MDDLKVARLKISVGRHWKPKNVTNTNWGSVNADKKVKRVPSYLIFKFNKKKHWNFMKISENNKIWEIIIFLEVAYDKNILIRVYMT